MTAGFCSWTLSYRFLQYTWLLCQGSLWFCFPWWIWFATIKISFPWGLWSRWYTPANRLLDASYLFAPNLLTSALKRWGAGSCECLFLFPSPRTALLFLSATGSRERVPRFSCLATRCFSWSRMKYLIRLIDDIAMLESLQDWLRWLYFLRNF